MRALVERTLAGARSVNGMPGTFRANRFANYPLGPLTTESEKLRIWVDASSTFNFPDQKKIEDINGERVLTVDMFNDGLGSTTHSGRSFTPNPLIASSKNYRVTAELLLTAEFSGGGEIGVFVQGQTSGSKVLVMGKLSSFFGTQKKRLIIVREDSWGNNFTSMNASADYAWAVNTRYTLVMERIAQTLRLKAWKTLEEVEPAGWNVSIVLAPGAAPDWVGVAGIAYIPGIVYKTPIPARFYDVQIDASDSRSLSPARNFA